MRDDADRSLRAMAIATGAVAPQAPFAAIASLLAVATVVAHLLLGTARPRRR